LTEAVPPAGLLVHLRRLAGHSALYGAADVGSQVINLLLTPLFVAFLSTDDMGIIALLILLSTLAKLLFRLGLDSGFLRVYYDQKTEESRSALSGTVALFAMIVGAALFLPLALTSAPLAHWLIPGVRSGAMLVRLALADVYFGSFLFVPLHLMRVAGQARRLATLLALRNVLNTGFKVALVWQGFGVTGVLVSDLLATVALALLVLPVMLRHATPVIRPALLREVLAFGLPKAPHNLMVQLLNMADRRILVQFSDLSTTGVYDKGYVLGGGVKFALSAFEPAWQPFVFSRIGQPDARETIARVVTYVWLVFVACGLGVAVFGRELLMVLTFTNRSFWPGAAVVPLIALAYLFHGAFLLTSIGVGIEKRSRYYPIMTAAAVVTNLAINYALIPRFGMLGAAWATVISYAVMAVLGYVFSHRIYPIPFETGRLARVSAAALGAFAVSRLVLPPAVAGLPADKWQALFTIVYALAPAVLAKAALLGVFPAALYVMGFFQNAEIARIRAMLRPSASAPAVRA
jgi:O-antigen/teichoic acid export membrane protein